MAVSDKTYTYQAFGLKIRSNLPFTELESADQSQPIDVDIVMEEAQERLAYPTYMVDVVNKRVSVLIPHAGLYIIEQGKRIRIIPFVGSDHDVVRLYILGTCLGVILIQRQMLPLHGSAVAMDGKAYAIIGRSGAGKSTLASTFLSLGHQLLSDDVIAITFKRGIPYVIPSFPQQKLWQDSLERLGYDEHQFSPIYGQATKFSVPVGAKFCREVIPLVGMIELVETKHYGFQLKKLSKLEQLSMIYDHTYRQFLIYQLDLMDWHFQTSAVLLEKTKVYQVLRSEHGVSNAQIAYHIMKNFGEEALVH